MKDETKVRLIRPSSFPSVHHSQSVPTISPSRGLQTIAQVDALIPALTVRTLPSASAAFIEPVCKAWSRR
jgi:hypothetical protein